MVRFFYCVITIQMTVLKEVEIMEPDYKELYFKLFNSIPTLLKN